jgi:hypothetical protein
LAWTAEIASPITPLSSSGSLTPSAREGGHIDWRGLRQNTDRTSACVISPTGSPTIAGGDPRRGRRRASRPAASSCRPDRSLSRWAMLPAHCLAECFLLTLKAGNLVRTYVDLIDRHRCSGGRRLLVDAQDTGQFVERLQLIMRLNLDSSAFRGDTPDQCRGVAR